MEKLGGTDKEDGGANEKMKSSRDVCLSFFQRGKIKTNRSEERDRYANREF